jgi:MFS transporter, ACS family, D-galactonate transporter
VLSPAVSDVLRDATGGWSTAVFVDAGLIFCAVLLFCFVRERAKSRVLQGERPREAEPRFQKGERPAPARQT